MERVQGGVKLGRESWQITWPPVWAAALHAKVSCPINYNRQASWRSGAHCLIYPRWPVHSSHFVLGSEARSRGRPHNAGLYIKPLWSPSATCQRRACSAFARDNADTVLALTCSGEAMDAWNERRCCTRGGFIIFPSDVSYLYWTNRQTYRQRWEGTIMKGTSS